MKLMICGSMTFAKEMIKTKKILEEMGHEVKISSDAAEIANGTPNHDNLEADFKHCVENDIMRKHFKFIEESEGVLVLNHDKNFIKGYV